VFLDRLLTGDRDAKIYLWNPDGTSWQVDSTPFSGHLDSVEDVQWSPVETDVSIARIYRLEYLTKINLRDENKSLKRYQIKIIKIYVCLLALNFFTL
jgi:WD40 repeat protein